MQKEKHTTYYFISFYTENTQNGKVNRFRRGFENWII